METSAPDVTVSVTVGLYITPTPTPTPLGSPRPGGEAAPKRYIGKPLVLYGYGPSGSDVSLTGVGISESTKTDSKGYFEFKHIYSYSYLYPELCVQLVDPEDRVTGPSCIPALKIGRIIPDRVGPVILSPTISIDENNVTVGTHTKAEGLTIPGSKLEIHISKQEENKLSLVGNAYAYNIPTYQIESDGDGKYEFSLPTQDAANYRLYASSFMRESRSAKSNTLNFSVLTSTQSFIAWSKDEFLNNKLIWFILLEIIIVVVLVIAILKKPTSS